MKPSQVAGALHHIASKIQNSKQPDRKLVAEDLRQVLNHLTAESNNIHTLAFLDNLFGGKLPPGPKKMSKGAWKRSVETIPKDASKNDIADFKDWIDDKIESPGQFHGNANIVWKWDQFQKHLKGKQEETSQADERDTEKVRADQERADQPEKDRMRRDQDKIEKEDRQKRDEERKKEQGKLSPHDERARRKEKEEKSSQWGESE
jgi:hypothetical protein